MPLLIVNINGTVKVPESGEHTNTPGNQQIITNALFALGLYNAEGWSIVGVSNQGGVTARNPITGKPFKSFNDCVAEQRLTLQYLKPLTVIYIAPDMSGIACWRVARTRLTEETRYSNYRLPGTGMLQLAIDRYNTGGNSQVLYVDDSNTGEDAAAELGIPFKYATTWWKEGQTFRTLRKGELKWLSH